jgi:hypothetical protein
VNDTQFQELAKAVRALSKRVLGKDAEIADAAGLSDETVVLQSQQITSLQERIQALEETVSAVSAPAPVVAPEVDAKVKSLDAQMMDVMKGMQLILQHLDDQAQAVALHDRTIEVIIREPVFEKKAG